MKKTNEWIWDKLARQNPFYAAVSVYDEENEAKKTEPQISFLLHELNDGLILDLGCGYGRIAKYLLPKRQFSGYIGIDLSIEMLKIFLDRYHVHEPKKKTPLLLIKAPIDNIPLRDESIDNVIVSAVFLHNHKSIVQRSIHEIYRIMKFGAKLFILSSFPNMWSINAIQGNLYLLYLKLIGQEKKNGPIRYFTEKEVRYMLKEFRKVSIFRVGFSIIPKDILLLPQCLKPIYRKIVFNPLQRLLDITMPSNIKRVFCAHLDVVAEK